LANSAIIFLEGGMWEKLGVCCGVWGKKGYIARYRLLNT